MSAHTAGPWYLKREGVVAQRASGEVIATLGFKVAVGSVEDDANAKLIAAAPTMYEKAGALADALRAYLGGEGERGDVDLALGELENVLAKMEAL